MRLFRYQWVRVLALLAMMIHGYASLTHHDMMISMAAASGDMTAAGNGTALGLGVMCRADGSQDIVDFDDLARGGSGKPAKKMNCPICSGAVPSVAIDAPEIPTVAAPLIAAWIPFGIANASLPVQRAAKPPSTGPPALG
jgi:hypothetical protein